MNNCLQGIWKSTNGRSGRLANREELSETPCSLSQEEAQRLVDSRTLARRNRDFSLADDIRTELTLGGVELFDRDNSWRSFDSSISGKQSQDFQTYVDKKDAPITRYFLADPEPKHVTTYPKHVTTKPKPVTT